MLAIKWMPDAVQGERYVSFWIFLTNPYLEVHNFQVAAQTSHQENCALLKYSCHFSRHLANGSNIHLNSVVVVSRISSRSQSNTGIPARAAGVQRQILGAWVQQVHILLNQSNISSSLDSAPSVSVRVGPQTGLLIAECFNNAAMQVPLSLL